MNHFSGRNERHLQASRERLTKVLAMPQYQQFRTKFIDVTTKEVQHGSLPLCDNFKTRNDSKKRKRNGCFVKAASLFGTAALIARRFEEKKSFILNGT